MDLEPVCGARMERAQLVASLAAIAAPAAFCARRSLANFSNIN
jgi:hypothetical protein